MAYLIVSVGLESGHSLVEGFWLKIFQEVVVKQLSCLLAAVLYEGSAGGRSASKFTYMIIGRIQFLVEFELRCLVPHWLA